ncbi:MAG: isochorismate synthase [Chloroflexaceae bacterium]|nr:isochorismate synthase [Chloroflexaceae bacterium]
MGKLIGNIGKFFSEAIARIFGPNDDRYPATGAQPFEGDPYHESSEPKI